MSLHYACIKIDARTTIEHSARGGTWAAQAQRILAKLAEAQRTGGGAPSSSERRASYASDKTVFHVLQSASIVYLAITDESYRQGLAFQFLAKMKEHFTAFRGPNATAQLQGALRREVETFNGPNADKLTKLQSEIDGVKGVMLENIDQLLERGEKIDNLVSQTEVLADQSEHFLSNSRTLRKKMWWRNVKLMILIVIVVLIILFVVITFACGGFTYKHCKPDPTAAPAHLPPPPTPATPAPTPAPSPHVA